MTGPAGTGRFPCSDPVGAPCGPPRLAAYDLCSPPCCRVGALLYGRCTVRRRSRSAPDGRRRRSPAGRHHRAAQPARRAGAGRPRHPGPVRARPPARSAADPAEPPWRRIRRRLGGLGPGLLGRSRTTTEPDERGCRPAPPAVPLDPPRAPDPGGASSRAAGCHQHPRRARRGYLPLLGSPWAQSGLRGEAADARRARRSRLAADPCPQTAVHPRPALTGDTERRVGHDRRARRARPWPAPTGAGAGRPDTGPKPGTQTGKRPLPRSAGSRATRQTHPGPNSGMPTIRSTLPRCSSTLPRAPAARRTLPRRQARHT